MFRNLIVGVDGQDGGRDAIALAKLLCAKDGQLTLAYVYNGEPNAWRGSSAAYDVAERERSHELLTDELAESGLEAELRSRGAVTVGRGLHELAEKIGADLLVIGSSRRGLLGRVLIGDDTHAALNGAPCSVAIAPAGYAHHPALMREIGIAYNGSPESEHAIKVARTIAAEHGCNLSAFEAVSLPSYAFTGAPLLFGDALEDLVKSARERIEALDGVEAHAAYGLPAEELTVYSASIDLLVVGSRSYGPVGRIVHGSTAQQLARSARCPLLVLTRAAREPEAAQESEPQTSERLAASAA